MLASAALAAEDSPLKSEIIYSGEVWNVAAGGIETGTRYLHNIDLTLGVDLDRHGIPGGSLFLHGLTNNKSELPVT